jgi:coenzyme F420-0:L-glutamate ligase / coenzyme F420-1:gamma-L-glutamate ligase
VSEAASTARSAEASTAASTPTFSDESPDPCSNGLHIWPVAGLPEIAPGDDLGAALAGALGEPGRPWAEPHDGDVVVVTQKVVSKAEGRIVPCAGDEAGTTATDGAPATATDGAQAPGTDGLPDKRGLVLGEARRVLRRRGDLLITETRHGFVCANSGVDLSNVAPGTAALLPTDPDRSARRIRRSLSQRLGCDVGVIVSDTFGRPWRNGVTDVAIGCDGIAAVLDLRGTNDAGGRPLSATEVCVADELASAAELVMGKDRRIAAAVIRGVPSEWLRSSSVAAEVVRRPADDLFR